MAKNTHRRKKRYKRNQKLRQAAEDLFAASVAADDDQWLQFQVEETAFKAYHLQFQGVVDGGKEQGGNGGYG